MVNCFGNPKTHSAEEWRGSRVRVPLAPGEALLLQCPATREAAQGLGVYTVLNPPSFFKLGKGLY